MNLHSLVFRRGAEYMTCWMMHGRVRLNDLVEFFDVGTDTQIAKNLARLADDMPKKVFHYKIGLRSGHTNGMHDEYFCYPRDVRYIVHELAKLAGLTPEVGAIKPANDFMIEQLVEQCDASQVARTAERIYDLSRLVRRNENVYNRLKRLYPDVAAALDLVAIEDAEDDVAVSLIGQPKKKARPYDLKKSTAVRFAPPQPEECEPAEEE